MPIPSLMVQNKSDLAGRTLNVQAPKKNVWVLMAKAHGARAPGKENVDRHRHRFGFSLDRGGGLLLIEPSTQNEKVKKKRYS